MTKDQLGIDLRGDPSLWRMQSGGCEVVQRECWLCEGEGAEGTGLALVLGGETRREGQASDGGRERGQPTLAGSDMKFSKQEVHHYLSNGGFNQLCSSVEDRFNIKAHFQSH